MFSLIRLFTFVPLSRPLPYESAIWQIHGVNSRDKEQYLLTNVWVEEASETTNISIKV